MSHPAVAPGAGTAYLTAPSPVLPRGRRAGVCPTGRAYGAISNAASGLTPVVFTSGPGVTTKEKLRVQYAPGSRTSAFTSLRRDQTFIVSIRSLMVSDSTVIGRFAWRFEEDETWQNEANIASAMSDTTALALTKRDSSNNVLASGVSVYWDMTYKGSSAWAGEIGVGDEYRFTLPYNEGITFDEGDSNTAHGEVMCSGRGDCNYVTGKCACQKGYTGSACERSE